MAHFSILREPLKVEMPVHASEITEAVDPIASRIAQRLSALRAERGWSLDLLATKTGISRATLSRLERGELSPTATLLNKLCAQYGWTASRLMAEAETGPPTVVRAPEQVIWKDPATEFVRRVVSPPHPNLKGELVEITLPPGSPVTYDVSPVPGLEHHLWMLDGALSLEIEGTQYRLKKGDCLRYVLFGPSRFECVSKSPARYLVSFVHPWR